MPNKGTFTIGVAKPRREKLGLIEGDIVAVRLESDTSKYGAPMPRELAEVLRQDPEGDRWFHALTAGKQRNMIYMIGYVKNSDRRIYLSFVLVEHLKQNGGKIIDAKLYSEIKERGADLKGVIAW